jgi:hypothetical protein
MRYFYELECRFVHGCLVALVPLPIAICLLHHDAALDEQLLNNEPHVEIGVLAVPHTQGDVFEIAEQCQVAVPVGDRWFLKRGHRSPHVDASILVTG